MGRQDVRALQRRQTQRIPLTGGQDRLRQMILYVSRKNQNARFFGRTKLNKILWKSDFSAFSERGIPVTGRDYQRLVHGPAPKEMLPLYREMKLKGLIREEVADFGDGIKEMRPIAEIDADLRFFTEDDLKYVERAIEYYWLKTGRETSDDSHGAAWRSRNDGDPMPYESALLSDRKIGPKQIERLRRIIDEHGSVSQ